MLNPALIESMPIGEDDKRILHNGEAAEAFLQSPYWQMLLDWAEGRANRALARLKEARWAEDRIKSRMQDKWQDDEEWLTQLQIHFKGMVADRDALIEAYSSVEQEMRDFVSPADSGVT